MADMIFGAEKLIELYIPFVAEVYCENIDILHGCPISVSRWRECLLNDADQDEINYILTANGVPAAWMKLNGFETNSVYISMLVVAKKYQRRGLGSYGIHFAEKFASRNEKEKVLIQTTVDNTPACCCYQNLGYEIIRYMEYKLADGIVRKGILFCKHIK